MNDPLDNFKDLVRLKKDTKIPIDKFKEIAPDRDKVLSDFKAGKCDIGILMRGDFVAIDVDPRNEGDPVNFGLDLRTLGTLEQRTGGGGWHFIFKIDKNPHLLRGMRGVDIQTGNKYIKYYGFTGDCIKPLSMLPDNFFYEPYYEKDKNLREGSKRESDFTFLGGEIRANLILKNINVYLFDNNDDWLIFCASYLTLYKNKSEGRRALIEWSLQDTRYSSDVIARINSLDGSKFGAKPALKHLRKFKLWKPYFQIKEMIV